MTTKTKTLRELQTTLPWGAHDYNVEFQAREAPQRDAEHALLHIQKAAGKLAGVLDGFSHADDARTHSDATHAEAGRALADVVISALRLGNTFPHARIDAQAAVDARIAEKFPARATGG